MCAGRSGRPYAKLKELCRRYSGPHSLDIQSVHGNALISDSKPLPKPTSSAEASGHKTDPMAAIAERDESYDDATFEAASEETGTKSAHDVPAPTTSTVSEPEPPVSRPSLGLSKPSSHSAQAFERRSRRCPRPGRRRALTRTPSRSQSPRTRQWGRPLTRRSCRGRSDFWS